MIEVLYVAGIRRDEILTFAADQRCPVVVTRRQPEGWSICKTTFAGCDAERRELYLEALRDEGGSFVPLVRGELLGMAFRRGHKKCLFRAAVIDPGASSRRAPAAVPGATALGAVHTLERSAASDLLATGHGSEKGFSHQRQDAASSVAPGFFAVRWPDDLQELQRRVYQRAAPPPDRAILVRVRRQAVPPSAGTAGGSSGKPAPQSAAWVGRLEDLSAGGIRLCAEGDFPARNGETFTLGFSPRPRDAEWEIECCFRHRGRRSDGKLSLGFQFVGLETTTDGQRTLEQLARLVTDFQRSSLRHRAAGRSPALTAR